eukprot:5762105-Lingulodinium_polyedra.AAC.1
MAFAYSSRSQGNVERWHKELWGLCHVYKLTAERDYGVNTTPQQPLTVRIAKRAAWVYNRYQSHVDGRT